MTWNGVVSSAHQLRDRGEGCQWLGNPSLHEIQNEFVAMGDARRHNTNVNLRPRSQWHQISRTLKSPVMPTATLSLPTPLFKGSNVPPMRTTPISSATMPK